MRRALSFAFILALAATAWTLSPNASAAVTPGQSAPELAGDNWVNSKPLTIAWPTIVLIDKKGIIRYSHFGEGAYEQTQSMIAKLLVEAA